jgi:hypothetical protein
MCLKNHASSIVFAIAILCGFGALAVPSVALATDEEGGCKINCKTCKVNMSTGQAECSDCTISGCTVTVE